VGSNIGLPEGGTIMKNPKVIAGVLGLLCFLTVSETPAQSTGMRYGPGIGTRSWRGENRCWKASEMNLVAEQTRGLDTVSQGFLKETRLLRSELFSKRLELRESLTDVAVKNESIQIKISQIIDLQLKLEEKTMDYLLKIRTLLTPEQLKNWCPELEISPMQGMMPRPDLMSPMPHRKVQPPEKPKED
jgi:hypothetical protein